PGGATQARRRTPRPGRAQGRTLMGDRVRFLGPTEVDGRRDLIEGDWLMTLINDVIGVGLTFGMALSSPACPTIEVTVGENGKIVVLRQTGTDGDARE